MRDTINARIDVEVTYVVEGVSGDQLKDMLEDVARYGFENGLFTRETDADVLDWDVHVSTTGEQYNVINARLILNVTYRANGVSGEELRDNLAQMVRHGYQNGLFTCETNAEVEAWELQTSILSDTELQHQQAVKRMQRNWQNAEKYTPHRLAPPEGLSEAVRKMTMGLSPAIRKIDMGPAVERVTNGVRETVYPQFEQALLDAGALALRDGQEYVANRHLAFYIEGEADAAQDTRAVEAVFWPENMTRRHILKSSAELDAPSHRNRDNGMEGVKEATTAATLSPNGFPLTPPILVQDWGDFYEWGKEAGYDESYFNVRDSKCLALQEQYLQEMREVQEQEEAAQTPERPRS